MKKIVRLSVRVLLVSVALLTAAVFGWAMNSRNMPELEIWHTTELPSRFGRQDIEKMSGLDDYLQREARLFEEVQRLVYDQKDPADRLDFNRYHRGSNTDPSRFPQDFNRSWELQPSGPPRCGVLLVHGLTDSPYSMRHLAQIYQAEGCYALVLRMPGHGTVPTGLV